METTKEIKQYKSLVWVEVAFWPKIDYLYWEWTEEQFKTAIQFDYVYFAIYNRNVANSKIKDFKAVKDVKNVSREMKISHLTENQKNEVKELASRMLKNIWREPTDSEFDNMIKTVLHGEKTNEVPESREISKIERFRKWQIKRRQKIAKVVTWSYIWFEK